MALQFIMGAAGSGKTTWLYDKVIREAGEHPEMQYIMLVPDQFTLETQKDFVLRSEGGGILNIDVLSFHRLAYRALEEIPALRKTVLEDMGKMMLLRKVFTEQKEHLQYFKRGLHRSGFLDECKSFLCELEQYAIEDADFDIMLETVGEDTLMGMKIADLRLIRQAFQEKMGERYMMAEELIPQLVRVVKSLEMMKHCVVCLDGFTGFTPTQYELLEELLICCEDVYVTVTMDITEKRDDVFSMSRDTIRRLSHLAGNHGVPIEEPIWTGKGKEKTPYRIAGNEELVFLEKNLFAVPCERWNGKPNNIEITLCHREKEEAAYAARQIWWLVQEKGYHYEDIAVVTADIATYEQSLSREMDRLGIPYFMDYKKSIGANAMAEFVMSFCQMVEKGLDYESTFRFLRCGLSPLTKEQTDRMENYVLAQGCRGLVAYKEEWQYEVKHLDLVEINQYRILFLSSVEKTITKLQGGRKTVRAFTEILYQFLLQSQVYEKLQEKSRRFEEEGKTILAKEYKSIYRLMMTLFDDMVELLGEDTVTFREYIEILAAGISEGLVGFIPPTAHQVVVGDVRRTRLKNVKVLFFLAVNDDCIPQGKGAPGILSETERRKLGEAGIELAPDATEESYREKFYLYLALTKPSERLVLTYSAMKEDGSSKRPAYLISKIKELFPQLAVCWEEEEQSVQKILGSDCGKTYLIQHLSDGTYEKDSAWWEIASFYERKQPGIIQQLLMARDRTKKTTKLHKEVAERLYGKVLEGSVTRFEQFVKCPYAHFVNYGLGLEERAKYEISTLDHGNIFHKTLEHFSHELEKREKNWQELSEAELYRLAEESVDYAVSRYEGKKYFQSKRTEFMVHRLKNEVRNSVWAMWQQMREGKFYQHYTEKYFSANGEDGLEVPLIPLTQNHAINLRGVIDRVDVNTEEGTQFVKIIDYKSSNSMDLSLAEIYYGLQMQLVTYMSATRELLQKEVPSADIIPAAILYYAIKEENLDWKQETEEERTKRRLDSMKCKGYVNIMPTVQENMGDEYPRAISTKQFELLMEHTREKMKQCGEDILDGELKAAPYHFKNKSGCDYCPMRAVCGVDCEREKNTARVMEDKKEEEIWEVLNEQYQVDQ